MRKSTGITDRGFPASRSAAGKVTASVVADGAAIHAAFLPTLDVEDFWLVMRHMRISSLCPEHVDRTCLSDRTAHFYRYLNFKRREPK